MNLVKCLLCVAFVTLFSHELAVAQFADENDFYFDDGSEMENYEFADASSYDPVIYNPASGGYNIHAPQPPKPYADSSFEPAAVPVPYEKPVPAAAGYSPYVPPQKQPYAAPIPYEKPVPAAAGYSPYVPPQKQPYAAPIPYEKPAAAVKPPVYERPALPAVIVQPGYNAEKLYEPPVPAAKPKYEAGYNPYPYNPTYAQLPPYSPYKPSQSYSPAIPKAYPAYSIPEAAPLPPPPSPSYSPGIPKAYPAPSYSPAIPKAYPAYSITHYVPPKPTFYPPSIPHQAYSSGYHSRGYRSVRSYTPYSKPPTAQKCPQNLLISCNPQAQVVPCVQPKPY